jgi:hypothetical protein
VRKSLSLQGKELPCRHRRKRNQRNNPPHGSSFNGGPL